MFNVYCGPAPTPATLASAWNPDAAALLFAAVIWGAHVVLFPYARKGALTSAMALFVLLFVSPLCTLTAALFSARAFHHIALVAGVAPLLAIAIASSSQAGEGKFSRGIHVSVGWIAALHAVIFWIWHAPPIYEIAIVHPIVYWTMQASLLGSSYWLWRRIFDMRASTGSILLALLGTWVQMSMLGALLTFASVDLYAPHFATTMLFGLSPLQDQQLAGLIMWVPATLPYVAAAMYRIWPLLAPSSRSVSWSG